MKIKLTWKNINTDAEAHRIYRSLTPFDREAMPEPHATVGAAAETYTDNVPPADTEVYYMVGVVRGEEEALSVERSIDTTEVVHIPTLSFDFRTGVYGTRELASPEILLPHTLGDILVADRNTRAAMWDDDGRYELAPINYPRVTHKAITGEPDGLLVEPTRSNLLYPSFSVSVNGDGVLPPTVTAVSDPYFPGQAVLKLVFPANGSKSGFSRMTMVIADTDAGARLAFRVFLRQEGTPKTLSIHNWSGYTETVVTPTATWEQYGTPSVTTPTGYSNTIRIAAHEGQSMFVDGGTLYLAAPQVEVGEFPSTPNPTQVDYDRNADQVSLAGGIFNASVLPTTGTWALDFESHSQEDYLALFSLSDGVFNGTNATAALVVAEGGGGLEFLSGSSKTAITLAQAVKKAVITLDGSSVTLHLKDQAPRTLTPASLPVASRVGFGEHTAEEFRGHLTYQRVTYYPEVLDTETIQNTLL